MSSTGQVYPAQRAKLPTVPFEKKLTRLEKALCTCENEGLVQLGKDLTPDFDFGHARDLGNRRNSLLHGEPRTLAIWKNGAAEFDVANVNIDTAHDRAITLDTTTLEQMAKDATELADRLSYIVGNLAFAKEARGRTPLRITSA